MNFKSCLNTINTKKSFMDSNISSSIVLEYETYIDIPDAKPQLSIPAGIYYPSIHDETDRFILLKSKPQRFIEQDIVNDIASLSIDESNLSINDHSTQNGSTPKTNEFEKGYFPIHEYHCGLEKVEASLQQFLKSKDFYVKNNLGYKRSVLLFGDPGTGKSRYIDNFCKRMIHQENAVIIRIEHAFSLIATFQGIPMLTNILKNRIVIFVIEELASLIENNKTTELLNLLDHSQLRDGYIFLMTTNNPELIPDSIVNRPSRVDVLMNVDLDHLSDDFTDKFYEHITGNTFPEEWRNEPFYTQKLSPAYLKELFVSMIINETTMQSSWEEIENRKRLVKNSFKSTNRVGFAV